MQLMRALDARSSNAYTKRMNGFFAAACFPFRGIFRLFMTRIPDTGYLPECPLP